MNKFLNDLTKGKIGERALSELLDKISIAQKINTTKTYDLWADINGSGYTFECKYDIMADKTGNIAIEYLNSKTNKPSGLMATEAYFWVIIFKSGEIWITKTDCLKDFVNKNSPDRNLDKAGDGNASIFLYKKEKILTIFRRIDNMTSEELLDYFNRSE